MEQVKKIKLKANYTILPFTREGIIYDAILIGNSVKFKAEDGYDAVLDLKYFEVITEQPSSTTSTNVTTTFDIKPEQAKKVKCINNRGAEYILVIGQEYKVIREQKLYYIIDHENYGELQLYKKFFEVEIEDKIKPQHYEQPITPIEFIMKNNIPFIEGNVIKYICRYKQKNGKEDLLKAKQYIDFLLEQYGN